LNSRAYGNCKVFAEKVKLKDQNHQITMESPKWNVVIDKALEVLRMSDNGYVMLDMYNNLLTPEEAAFKKLTVTPYNAAKFIQTQFSALGLDISDKHLRIKLIALLEEYDRLQKLKG
jgi:hypothetical protein